GVQIHRARSGARFRLPSHGKFSLAESRQAPDCAKHASSRRMDFPGLRDTARFAMRARALPAPHLLRGLNARSRKSESTSPPSFPPHDEKDVQLVETRAAVPGQRVLRSCVCHSVFAVQLPKILLG